MDKCEECSNYNIGDGIEDISECKNCNNNNKNIELDSLEIDTLLSGLDLLIKDASNKEIILEKSNNKLLLIRCKQMLEGFKTLEQKLIKLK